VARHDLPHDVEVHAVITADETVAETDDLRPWDLGVSGLFLWRNAVGGLTDDLEEPNDSKTEDAVLNEVLSPLPAHE
jgi:hypothetical protein